MTYREAIRQLDGLATPAPWVVDNELYGVRENGVFMPLGFAPHRPLDARLIVVYRSALMQLIEAMDAIERLAWRANAQPSVPAAIGIRQVLAILDAVGSESPPFRPTLIDLDHKTTPPNWDPGHLILGMELDAALRTLGVAAPQLGDPALIAVARIAVPRALDVLAFIERIIAVDGLRDGHLRGAGAGAILGAVAAFDQHRSDEGSGTGTV